MEQRIQQFELMWRAVYVAPPPQLVRAATPEFTGFDIPVLTHGDRQTNAHELLPPDLREKWWSATSKSDKDDIMFQYESMFW